MLIKILKSHHFFWVSIDMVVLLDLSYSQNQYCCWYCHSSLSKTLRMSKSRHLNRATHYKSFNFNKCIICFGCYMHKHLPLPKLGISVKCFEIFPADVCNADWSCSPATTPSPKKISVSVPRSRILFTYFFMHSFKSSLQLRGGTVVVDTKTSEKTFYLQ